MSIFDRFGSKKKEEAQRQVEEARQRELEAQRRAEEARRLEAQRRAEEARKREEEERAQREAMEAKRRAMDADIHRLFDEAMREPSRIVKPAEPKPEIRPAEPKPVEQNNGIRPVEPKPAAPQAPRPVGGFQNRPPRQYDSKVGSAGRTQGPIGGDLSMASIHRLGTKILLDSSAAACPGLGAFSKEFHATRPQPNRFLFLPDFCAGDVGDNAALIEQLLAARVVIKWEGSADYAALLEKRANFAPFLVLVNDVDRAVAIQQAAFKSKVQIRLVQLMESGALKPMLLPSRQSQPRWGQGQSPEKPAEDAFQIATTFAQFRYGRLARGPVGVGSAVTTGSGAQIRLGKEITHNENSITYAIEGSDKTAKIYSAEKLTTLEMYKCERMLQKKIAHPGLCWPQEVLKDDKGTFIGFTTGSFRGVPLNACIMQPDAVKEHFPAWGKAELSRLAQTVMEKIHYMHTHGILFGSIDPASILVQSETEVYFLDTDRYQVEGFPCMKYSYAFCAPEALDKAGKLHLTTLDEERFAVAELAFAIIMPGKTSYPSETGGDALRNIREMRFPYSWGEHKGAVDDRRKIGQWRYVWSHLSPDLKECFYKTFMYGNVQFKSNQRRSAGVWTKLFGNFAAELNSEELFDKNSRLLFPPSFKRSKKDTFIRCQVCGVEHPDWFFRKDFLAAGEKLCRPCLRKQSDDGFTCKKCGKYFAYTNEASIFHKLKQESGDWKRQKYCYNCKNKKETCIGCGQSFSITRLRDDGRCGDCHEKWRNAPYQVVTCKGCYHTFTITNGDAEFYRKKGMNFPVRCKECREKRKNQY